MESILKIGDKVRVGDRIGEVIRLDPKGSSTVIKVAFEEGPAKDFVCPPTKVEKILSPIEQIENNKFDSPIHFDLHYEAIRLSLAYAYDQICTDPHGLDRCVRVTDRIPWPGRGQKGSCHEKTEVIQSRIQAPGH